MEPAANHAFSGTAEPHEVAAVSIAISLKRIADAIEGTPARLGIVDGIMHAIEQGFIAGRNG